MNSSDKGEYPVNENGAPPPGRWRNVHPDFDGHLERPLSKMTVQERLDWIDEMIRFRHWAKTELRQDVAKDNDTATGE